ncbi:MAG: 4Fe-4S binding protein, partial [Desulfomonilia bacterium]|nr:4Fe-4S binding protein [Desulfomonilia bacterium]
SMRKYELRTSNARMEYEQARGSAPAHPDQRALAEVFTSVSLLGPPMSDTLLELVCHLFSPEEAAVARYLPFYLPKPIETIARRALTRPEEIREIVLRLAERRVIYSNSRGYALLPLIPGMFEYLLMDGRDTPWHRRYAQLIVDLFGTGYSSRYNTSPSPLIRTIPIQTAVEEESRVVDADLMSEMIACHDRLAVLNVCQCRQSLLFVGHECSRSSPQDGCLVFGSFAESTVESGSGRFVSREEMRDIVQERWENNLVFMSANLVPTSSNAICTCCDCCCHYLESINTFKGRMSLAPPHFLALVDESSCTSCGKCVKVCNTHAHSIEDRVHTYNHENCIGCGLCVTACPVHAITLAENPDYRPPSRSWLHHGLRILPGSVLSAMKIKLTSSFESIKAGRKKP